MNSKLPKLALIALLPGWTGLTRADSNVLPDQAFSWGGNVGWLHWRPQPASGVEVGQFICSGNIYSPTVGWICLGDGSPDNSIQYQNNSGRDFGINVDQAGNLRGFAYGANIGWINFETTGNARLDFNTGKLIGFAYGANVGWIALNDTLFSLAIDTIAPGADTDSDSIPDAWELSYADALTVFSADSDRDRDGQNDLQEYLADTDPFDRSDQLQVVSSTLSADKARLTLTWTSKPTRRYLIETRSQLGASSSWVESGLGLQLSSGIQTARTLETDPAWQFFRIRAVRPLGAD